MANYKAGLEELWQKRKGFPDGSLPNTTSKVIFRCSIAVLDSPRQANFEDRGLSWKFEVTGEANKKHVSESRRKYAAQVMLADQSTQSLVDSTDLLFEFPTTAIKGFYQQSMWRFRLKANKSFVFEVIRNDHFDTTKSRSSPAGKRPACSEWYAQVYHDCWDEVFGDNYTLKVGRSASWVPSIDTFFPLTLETKPSIATSGLAEFEGHMREIIRRLTVVEMW